MTENTETTTIGELARIIGASEESVKIVLDLYGVKPTEQGAYDMNEATQALLKDAVRAAHPAILP